MASTNKDPAASRQAVTIAWGERVPCSRTLSILGDTSLPGVRAIIERVREQGTLSPQAIVAACLDAVGSLEVSEATHAELLAHAANGGGLAWNTSEEIEASEAKVGKILTLIAASRDYQFA